MEESGSLVFLRIPQSLVAALPVDVWVLCLLWEVHGWIAGNEVCFEERDRLRCLTGDFQRYK